MGPFRGPYRGSPLRDPCWWAVSTEVAAHWEEVLMGLFRGGTHNMGNQTMSNHWKINPKKIESPPHNELVITIFKYICK